jgi:RNA polymerase sigma factor (sigma-70 family)
VADESDATVIESSVGDPDRFEIIFERHYDSISRYAKRRAGSDAGSDIASETFVVAFSRRDSFDTGYTSAKPWLFGIATNLIRRHARSERGLRTAIARLPRDREPQAPLDDAAVEAARLGPRVRELLVSLPGEDRDAFLLMALGELTYQEIAIALAIPVGTVRSKIHRVRTSLRERLGSDVARRGQSDDE